MKKTVLDFLRRGIFAAWIGPLVLAVLYLSLGVPSLSASEVAIGIFSLTVLAFLAGGLNALYGIERLPLLVAVLIHGALLYLGYLATYLVNGWLEWGVVPLLVFSVIFAVGYLVIWAVIYAIIRKRTRALNALLEQKQAQE
jgi:hypothetical protein